ncbi:tetratricopeptide repeat protein [Belliella aquatica]|uniref:Tetratricopeptide repeat protein n=1 Tax=Belliella aquatica TaxID=1323734 RepID=A0ABQ1M8C0_9BACT|nr:hypothetical protein [Belliella aquatica]MCH7404628.1 hypothetical protein [Belliella aquatica]GGC35414.1 hypothetical protein GCM10010993_12900 [Belliella aquatica]
MKIILKRDQFLANLFSTANINDDSGLEKAILDAYFPLVPEISFGEDKVLIDVPVQLSKVNEKEFFKATELCRQGGYKEAIMIFESLRGAMIMDSEYYRNYAQAYEEIGESEKAIDLLIESLRFDPKNKWALLLMGNIYIKHYSDFDTASTYFDKVIDVDPKNHLVLSNIGGMFLKADKLTLAGRFFNKALESKADFPNALHGMGILLHKQGRMLEAFDYGCKALSNAENTDSQKVFIGFLTNLASEYVKDRKGNEALAGYFKEVQDLSKKLINIEIKNTIESEAKLELAENYKRDHHLILYKENVVFVDHLIAHELTHLKYIQEARKENSNMQFTSGLLEKKRFKTLMEPVQKKLLNQGLAKDKVEKFIEMVFHGTNSRIYNAPIDLFIEDHIFNSLPELKPYQFLSLSTMGKLSLQAVTDSSILAVTPPEIISKIKVYNALSARQFDELFGMQTEKDYPLSRQEKDLIDKFWDEFNEYRNDKEPGEEYELIENWGKDLGLNIYFKLQEEAILKEDSRTQLSIDDLDLDKMNHDRIEAMTGALLYLREKDQNKLEAIAFETAMVAKRGVGDDEKGLTLHNIPEKTFDRDQFLAYYYVSWALIRPDFLDELGLDYEKEFQFALIMVQRESWG